ncbi:hypothetical protein [Kibdelosporangium philippinense]|uniref:hypothetical protein n=1 Tax=Kibdelosporangium philippinense TaxID=211113 RepID=UPI00360B668C
MGVRIVDHHSNSNVIPLYTSRTPSDRDRSTVVGLELPDLSFVDAPLPEPSQLYGLIVLAFLLHKPTRAQRCVRCGTRWPCEHLRLAYRLREAF